MFTRTCVRCGVSYSEEYTGIMYCANCRIINSIESQNPPAYRKKNDWGALIFVFALALLGWTMELIGKIWHWIVG
jgi:hypothetical protein